MRVCGRVRRCVRRCVRGHAVCGRVRRCGMACECVGVLGGVWACYEVC